MKIIHTLLFILTSFICVNVFAAITDFDIEKAIDSGFKGEIPTYHINQRVELRDENILTLPNLITPTIMDTHPIMRGTTYGVPYVAFQWVNTTTHIINIQILFRNHQGEWAPIIRSPFTNEQNLELIRGNIVAYRDGRAQMLNAFLNEGFLVERLVDPGSNGIGHEVEHVIKLDKKTGIITSKDIMSILIAFGGDNALKDIPIMTINDQEESMDKDKIMDSITQATMNSNNPIITGTAHGVDFIFFQWYDVVTRVINTQIVIFHHGEAIYLRGDLEFAHILPLMAGESVMYGHNNNRARVARLLRPGNIVRRYIMRLDQDQMGLNNEPENNLPIQRRNVNLLHLPNQMEQEPQNPRPNINAVINNNDFQPPRRGLGIPCLCSGGSCTIL